jgi:hypothetical protein
MFVRLWMFALTLGAALAQTPVTTGDPSERVLVELLNRDRARNFAVMQGEHHDGPVAAVFGDLGKGSSLDLYGTAKEFIKKYGAVIGWPDGELLTKGIKELRRWDGDAGHFLTFVNQLEGVPYLNSQVVFCFARSGELVAVLGRYKPVEYLDTSSLTLERAIAIAPDCIKEEYPEHRNRITGHGSLHEYLVDSRTAPGLVERLYHMQLTVGEPEVPVRVVINAKGVAVLVQDGRLTACDADVFPRDPFKDAREVSERDIPDIKHPGSWRKDYIVDGHYVTPVAPHAPERAASFFCGFDDHPPFQPDKHPQPVAPFVEANVYYHVTRARAQAWKWEAPETDNVKPLVYDHWYEAYCDHLPQRTDTEKVTHTRCVEALQNNAFFNPANRTLNFPWNNPKLGRKHGGYDSAAIYHEYGHYLHSELNRHWFVGGSYDEFLESKAMSEAFGDIYSAAVSGYPDVGSWFLGKRARDIGTLHTITEARPLAAHFTDLEMETENLTLHEFHQAGMVFGSFYWRMRKREGKSLPADDAIKSMLLAYRLARAPTTFREGSLALLAADQMRHGAGAHAKELVALLAEHELVRGARWPTP